MIQIIAKAITPAPDVLTTDGKNARTTLEARYNHGERNFTSGDFNKGIYGHKDVKNVLIDIQGYKCCFCESKIGHIDDGDVKHFRPKAGWVQDEEPINKPGYYWLAYEWDNLLLSCGKCNQRFKKNYFPLANNERALSHHDSVDNEEPLFIHPGRENAELFITFNEEIPKEVDENVRGYLTIKKLQLDRGLLNEQRKSKLDIVRDIYDLVKGLHEKYPGSELTKEGKIRIERLYNLSQLDTTEYASMLRAFFIKNPIDF